MSLQRLHAYECAQRDCRCSFQQVAKRNTDRRRLLDYYALSFDYLDKSWGVAL